MNMANKYTRWSRWHSRGQRFDPAYLHQKSTEIVRFWCFFFVLIAFAAFESIIFAKAATRQTVPKPWTVTRQSLSFFFVSVSQLEISLAVGVHVWGIPSSVTMTIIRRRNAFSHVDIFSTPADMTPKILCRLFSACIFFNVVLCLR